jgi:hypothetical protein
VEHWIEELIACLLPAPGTEANARQFLLLKDAKIPPLLYRYMSVKPESLETLAGDHVWLTSPAKYNDPFDSTFTYSMHDAFKPIVRQHFDHLVVRGFGHLLTPEDVEFCRHQDDPLQHVVRLGLSRFPEWDGDALGFLRPIVDRIAGGEVARWSGPLRDRLRICCFTTDRTNALMWAHYADSHKGLCVEYPFGSLPRGDERRRFLFPVAYRGSLFDATAHVVHRMEHVVEGTPDKTNPFFIVGAAMTKASEWAYEQEWRYIIPPGCAPEGYWPAPKPSRVMLGAMISAENEDQVRRLAEDRGIPVQRMALSHREYRVIEAEPAAVEIPADPAEVALVAEEVDRVRRSRIPVT